MLLSTLCFNFVLEALGGCGWRPPPILKSDWRGFGPIALRCWRWGRPMISIVSVCAAMLSRGGACWQGCWWDNNGRGVASGWCTIVSNGNWYVGKRKKDEFKIWIQVEQLCHIFSHLNCCIAKPLSWAGLAHALQTCEKFDACTYVSPSLTKIQPWHFNCSGVYDRIVA